jgi:hypothetical protein
MNMNPKTEEKSANQLRIVEEALRQTELHLEDIASIASAADQRAMAFAGFAALVF